MKFNKLFHEERAVSPVIGVILMVAITVILAAVIGTFVLGLGDQIQETTPQASIGFDTGTQTYTDTTGDSFDATTVTITHESGDTLQENNLDVVVNGNPAYDVQSTGDDSADESIATIWDSGGSVSAGNSVRVAMYDTNGATDTDSDAEPSIGVDAGSGFTPTDIESLTTDDTIRVIWNSPSSDKSATLGKFTLP